jgi:hypothetical protein
LLPSPAAPGRMAAPAERAPEWLATWCRCRRGRRGRRAARRRRALPSPKNRPPAPLSFFLRPLSSPPHAGARA